MNLAATATQILNALRPLVAFVALLFAVMAAWKGLTEVLPVLAQIFSPRGDAQRMAIIAGALALAAKS